MFANLLLVVAVLGTLSSSVYLLMVLAGCWRFNRRSRRSPVNLAPAPVTILKPLHGAEPRLLQNLEGFFRQDYPAYEIVFGVRSECDPALEIVRELMARYPCVPVQIVVSGDPGWPNAKAYNLSRMQAAARHPYLIISDSDVAVEPGYAGAIMADLQQPRVGVVTCLYRGMPTAGIWTKLEALGMSVELPSGVLVADMLEGMKFALGPTMAVTAECLGAIGGFQTLSDYLADDFVLGNRAAGAGYKVVLSSHVIDHVVRHSSVAKSFQHQVRWTKSTRCSRPKGHLGTGLTFAVPFGMLGLIGGIVGGRPYLGTTSMPHLGLILLLAALVNRVIQCLAVGYVALDDGKGLRLALLYPLRDFLGFVFWLSSYFGGRYTTWRGERCLISADGRMEREPVLTSSGD